MEVVQIIHLDMIPDFGKSWTTTNLTLEMKFPKQVISIDSKTH
jgi:hypothetical protein